MALIDIEYGSLASSEIMNKNFTLSASDFTEILNERFASCADVQLVVTGNSMLPFLADKRDKVTLTYFNFTVFNS